MSLLNLPDDLFEKVFSYISYDEVSRCRLVCRRFNYVCKRVLNRGFHKVKKYLAQSQRNIKLQLLKLESERRTHPLAKHDNILLDVKISLLDLGELTESYMESDIGCFIPGKILDEINIILRSLTFEQLPEWVGEALQKLRVLTSLAVEHFRENIYPAFRKRELEEISDFNNSTPPVPCHCKCSGCHLAGEQDVHEEREEGSLQEQNATSKKVQFLEQKVSEVNTTNSELENKANELQALVAALGEKANELQALVAAQVEKAKEQDLRLDFLSGLIDRRSMHPSKSSNQSKVKNSLTGMKSTLIKDNLRPYPRKKKQTRAVTNQTDKPRKRLKQRE